MFSFDDFHFDPYTGQLSRGSSRAVLAPQIAGVLELLLEHAGEVVSREEFRKKLWPDTTVEFDQGLNFCIRQLRVALGDDAQNPAYVETLPRRGYRFRASVQRDTEQSPPPADDWTRPRQRTTKTVLLAGAASLLVAAVAGLVGLAVWRERDARHPVFAVIPFDADTLTLAADGGRFRDGLIESILERTTARVSPGFVVVGPGMTQRFGSRTPIDSVRAAVGAAYALSGAVHRRQNVVEVFAQLVRASDRGHLWVTRVTDSSANGYEDIGRRIADSAAAIILDVKSPRPPLGIEQSFKPVR